METWYAANARSMLRRYGRVTAEAAGMFRKFRAATIHGVQKNKVEYSERNFSIGGTPRGRKIVRSGALSLSPGPSVIPAAPAAHVFTA